MQKYYRQAVDSGYHRKLGQITLMMVIMFHQQLHFELKQKMGVMVLNIACFACVMHHHFTVKINVLA